MKPIVIAAVLIALFGAGIGGGYWFIQQSNKSTPGEIETSEAGHEGHDHAEPTAHGKAIQIPENATVCATHGVPEVVCPFCDPSLIEERGFCGSHDVAEALCTRCSPVLIAAFKAEGDWCAEHGLPESQCLICNPDSGG